MYFFLVNGNALVDILLLYFSPRINLYNYLLANLVN